MANFNKVILLGNLTRDPIMKKLPSGTTVAEIGLAVNRKWNDPQTREPRESTCFVDCTAMGRQAEVIEQYCHKGNPLLVEGRLEYRSWEAKDGTKRSKLEVFVEGFQLLGARRDGSGVPSGGVAGREGGAPPPRARTYEEPRTGGGQAVEAGFEGSENQAQSAAPDDDVPF